SVCVPAAVWELFSLGHGPVPCGVGGLNERSAQLGLRSSEHTNLKTELDRFSPQRRCRQLLQRPKRLSVDLGGAEWDLANRRSGAVLFLPDHLLKLLDTVPGQLHRSIRRFDPGTRLGLSVPDCPTDSRDPVNFADLSAGLPPVHRD